MPNTPFGFPYPPATDPVAQGAAAIQALAEAIETRLAGVISHTDFTANVTVSVSAEASAQVVVTAPAYVSDGVTPILVEFFAMTLRTPGVAGGTITLVLFLDGVSIGRCAQHSADTATQTDAPVYVARRIVPAAGSRVFSMRAIATPSGSGLVLAGAGGVGAGIPGYLRLSRA